MEKHLSYNFHFWKNVYHRNFVQFSVRMELYDKKFLIYGNCMIRNFGHPGLFAAVKDVRLSGKHSKDFSEFRFYHKIRKLTYPLSIISKTRETCLKVFVLKYLVPDFFLDFSKNKFFFQVFSDFFRFLVRIVLVQNDNEKNFRFGLDTTQMSDP